MSKEGREVISTRVQCKQKGDLERLARRHRENLSSYAARVLEAHVRGNVFCARCGFEHEIVHSVGGGGNGHRMAR